MSNVYDVINSRIMELLEQGTVPWKKPWNAQSNYPKNLISGKKYQGVNVFMLTCQQYSSPYWLTFKQCQDKGGHVIKGSKSTPVIFWKWLDRNDVPDEDNVLDSKGSKVPLLRYFNVFNSEQVEGIIVPESEETNNNFNPIVSAQQIIREMPNSPLIQHMGNRAYYNPLSDTVTLPSQNAFDTAEEYYCTAFHELIHSTMHESRLNRKATIQVHKWGDESYSKEELVAEMGASFLCGQSCIENHTLENSAAYISGWLRVLKNDKTLLVQSAAAAQKAADFISNRKKDCQE